MENTDTDIIITDTIDADQIEVGDQIVLDGEYIEVATREDDPEDSDGIIVSGYSWDEGDRVEKTLPYNYRVDVWSI